MLKLQGCSSQLIHYVGREREAIEAPSVSQTSFSQSERLQPLKYQYKAYRRLE